MSLARPKPATYKFDMQVLLISSTEISRLLAIREVEAYPLTALSAGIAIVEIVRREDHRAGTGMHQRIWNVARMSNMMIAQIEVNNPIVKEDEQMIFCSTLRWGRLTNPHFRHFHHRRTC